VSTPTDGRPGRPPRTETEVEFESTDLFRALALASVVTLTSSYVSVFYFITTVVGGTTRLLLVTAVAFVGASVAARYLTERTAAALTGAFLFVGTLVYLSSVPQGFALVFDATGEVVADVVALLTGLPISRIKNPGVWTAVYVPAPLFLSWYLALRRRYVASALIGGVALSVLVLTGDAGGRVTLAGTLGAIGAVGFGELERYEGTVAQADTLAILFAIMMALSLVVPLAPGGNDTSPVYLFGGGGPDTLEASLTSAPEETTIQGSIRLSPAKRFTVETQDPQYMRVGVYDRFTGGSWLRTGETRAYDGALDPPPGETYRIEQTVTAEAELNVMPAAAEPLRLSDREDRTRVTDQGALLPKESLSEGDSYTVTSAVIDPEPADLRDAGRDYPEGINDTYLQTGGLSSAFKQRTARITQNAENPYDTAEVIERYLERTKEYSLDVDRPNGNVAESFLLEMDRGYCVYYATTMVMMLRSEGIPARYVVGYLPGTETGEDTYTVRGLDSHAWVEVYFPDHGWVTFDPTPGGPREAAEEEALEEAASEGEVTTEQTPTPTPTPTPTTAPTTTNGSNVTTTANGTTGGNLTATVPGGGQDPIQAGDGINGTAAETVAIPDIEEDERDESGGGGGDGPPIPPPEDVALGGILLLGLVAGVHRSGVPDRLWLTLQVRWQGARRSPDQDTERAYRRLELLLERRYRPRRGAETPRDYVDSLTLTGADDRVERVAELYEYAHYGDGVTETQADEAIALVDELVGERSPLPGRLS
jgi:transglutaminase-like putative cysteine protease